MIGLRLMSFDESTTSHVASSYESIPVSLIRQWCYCPRVVYYLELLNLKTEQPLWVKQGREFQQSEEEHWQRRNLSRFKLRAGSKFFNVVLKCDELGMHGIADMVIDTEFLVYPVEFKLSPSPCKRGDVLQLTAYAMLLPKIFLKPSEKGYFVGGGNILHTVAFDSEKRAEVISVVATIRKMLTLGKKPDSSASVYQCSACEYINYCNDRL